MSFRVRQTLKSGGPIKRSTAAGVSFCKHWHFSMYKAALAQLSAVKKLIVKLSTFKSRPTP